MFSAVPAYVSSSAIKGQLPRWLLAQTVVTLRVPVSAFGCCGVVLLTLGYVGEDLAINLWDLGSGKRIKKMTGHLASIYSLAFSAESSLLVSGSADWTVRCWDVKGSGGPKGKLRENSGSLPLGIASNEVPRSYGEAEYLETLVYCLLFL